MWASLVLGLLSNGPALFSDAESVVNDIAHGEGGLQKIENIVGALTGFLGHLGAAHATLTAQNAGGNSTTAS